MSINILHKRDDDNYDDDDNMTMMIMIIIIIIIMIMMIIITQLSKEICPKVKLDYLSVFCANYVYEIRFVISPKLSEEH